MRESSNPPAFPVDCNTNPDCDGAGMTLRDWFAGMALQALLPQSDRRMVNDLGWAGRAYQIADGMLKARADLAKEEKAAAFRCDKCGRSGEAVFSWDGKCLGCEDDGPDDEGKYEKQQMGSGW